MYQPSVSIITVNYKQPQVTSELLDSLRKLSYSNLEVIVVDNDQQYDDSPLYRIHYPEVKVINCDENLGFAGGNNVGIKAAKGDYLFLVNNDTEIIDGTIEKLVSVLVDENVGAVSPILRYFDAPKQVQYAGFTEINPITGRNRMINQIAPTLLSDTPYIHGAAVMIPKTVIDKCGLMPEDYFLYYEELCWSRKIRKAGYQLKVCNEVHVLHKESVTTGKNSPLKTYYQTRNRLVFMNRNTNFLEGILFKSFFILAALPINLTKFALRRQFAHFKAFQRAYKDAFVRPKLGMTY